VLNSANVVSASDFFTVPALLLLIEN